MYDAADRTPPAEDREYFSIADLARAVRKRLWLVVLIPILASGVAAGASLLKPPVYEASATVVVGPREANPQENLSTKISGLQVLAHEMAVLGLNRSMGEDVASAPRTGGVSESDVSENLTIAQVEDTRFLSLAYQDDDADAARAVANGAARVFARVAPKASGMASDAALTVSAYAPEPMALEDPDPLRNGLLALALGLMGGVGLAFLLELRSWRGEHTGAPVRNT